MLRKIWDFFIGCFRQVDLVLLALCTGTTLFGCLMIASATHYTGSYKNVIVQLAALCLGIVAYVLMSMLDLAEISKYWKWLLGGSLVLILLLKTPLGMESGGNRAWLGIEGIPVSLQPAEIVKITFILVLARQLVYLQENRDLKSIPSVAMLGGHLILIVGTYAVVSGDMGSALVFIFIFACMCFVAGVAKRWFVIGILGGSFAFYVLWETDKIDPYMPAGPAHGLYLLRYRRGAGHAGLPVYHRPFGGYHPALRAHRAPCPAENGHVHLRRRGGHADLSGGVQHRHVPVCDARHWPDAAVCQLWRHLHRDSVCRHGYGLRHTETRPARVAAVTKFMNQIPPGAASGCARFLFSAPKSSRVSVVIRRGVCYTILSIGISSCRLAESRFAL